MTESEADLVRTATPTRLIISAHKSALEPLSANTGVTLKELVWFRPITVVAVCFSITYYWKGAFPSRFFYFQCLMSHWSISSTRMQKVLIWQMNFLISWENKSTETELFAKMQKRIKQNHKEIHLCFVALHLGPPLGGSGPLTIFIKDPCCCGLF